MRHHLYVRRALAELRDKHGLNDAQLMAISPLVIRLTIPQLLRLRGEVLDEPLYLKLYRPNAPTEDELARAALERLGQTRLFK